MLSALLRNDLTSNTGQNISYLTEKYDCSDFLDLILKQIQIKHTRVYELPKEEQWKVTLIKELVLMNHGLLDGLLEDDEVEFLLEELCTK